jgi:hypothetical protein
VKKHLRKQGDGKLGREPVKVFFCEKLPQGLATADYVCQAGHRQTIERGRMTYEEWSASEKPPAIECSTCGAALRAAGGGFAAIFRRGDTGEEVGGRKDLPPGACFEMDIDRKGPDGRYLVVILPDRNSWHIDSRASNCRRAKDYEGFCWVRTGKPEDGTLDVRSCGCGAGAGSVRTPAYHGFLHRGFLRPTK